MPADWPRPGTVCAAVTPRSGGVSVGAWGLPDGQTGGLNLGSRCGDHPDSVIENRRRLRAALPADPHWLEQVHGVAVHRVMPAVERPEDRLEVRADASVTDVPGCVLAVLSADCLPVLLSDRSGRRIGAAHAGWRGLAGGVVENTVAALRSLPGEDESLSAWLGPAIGPAAFEVGDEVRQVFVEEDPLSALCFRPASQPGKWMADLFSLARQRLARVGVTEVWGGGDCTVADRNRFYSHRRDRVTGRMASLIWIQPGS